jgi:hypothetical protein
MKATKFVQIALFFLLIIVLHGCVKNKGCKDRTAINYSNKTKKGDESICRYAKDSPTVIFDCDSYSSYSGTSSQVIHLTKVPNATIDYVFTCDTYVNGTLLIDPGVTISFEYYAGLYVVNGGKIVANGTTTQPIVITGDENKWKGIYISSFGNNELRNVSIINGGIQREGSYPFIETTYSGSSALQISNPNTGNPSVVLQNVSIEKFGSIGISIETTNNNGLNFTNVQLKNGNVPVHLKSMSNQSILSSMSFSNNTNNYAQTNSVMLSFSNTFQDYGIPYYVRRGANANNLFTVGSVSGLTLSSGLKMILGDGIILRCGGPFNVQGTSLSPVIISGTGSSNWREINLTGTGSNGIHSINYCNISGSGKSSTAVIVCPTTGSGNIGFLNSSMSNVTSSVTCGIKKNSSFTLSTTGSTFGTIPNVSCN